jgi:hypothetical protein
MLGHFQIIVLSGVFPFFVKRGGKLLSLQRHTLTQLMSACKNTITTNTLLSDQPLYIAMT